MGTSSGHVKASDHRKREAEKKVRIVSNLTFFFSLSPITFTEGGATSRRTTPSFFFFFFSFYSHFFFYFFNVVVLSLNDVAANVIVVGWGEEEAKTKFKIQNVIEN